MTQLARRTRRTPPLFDDFFNRPWDSWLGEELSARSIDVPFVNISERENDYLVSMAAPGLKKEDFKIDVEGNMLTISSEKKRKRKKKRKDLAVRNTAIPPLNGASPFPMK